MRSSVPGGDAPDPEMPMRRCPWQQHASLDAVLAYDARIAIHPPVSAAVPHQADHPC